MFEYLKCLQVNNPCVQRRRNTLAEMRPPNPLAVVWWCFPSQRASKQACCPASHLKMLNGLWATRRSYCPGNTAAWPQRLTCWPLAAAWRDRRVSTILIFLITIELKHRMWLSHLLASCHCGTVCPASSPSFHVLATSSPPPPTCVVTEL